LVPFV